MLNAEDDRAVRCDTHTVVDRLSLFAGRNRQWLVPVGPNGAGRKSG